MAIVSDSKSALKVDPVNWENVRLIYKKLQDDFHLITVPFEIKLSDQANLHLSHLIATIDSIDRTLDNLPERSQRQDFESALLNYLQGRSHGIESDLATDEIRWRMRNLLAIVSRMKIQNEFCQTVAQIFNHTEQKRNSRNVPELIFHLHSEWRLAGHMTVLVMGPNSNPEFEKFFDLCCQMMTSVDMIRDAKKDFRNGELAIKPSFELYVRLFKEFIIPMPRLFAMFPRPMNLLKYAWGFLSKVYIFGD